MAGAASGGIDRRRVLAGIAWTTPAIVLAVSVPRAAASEESNCAVFLQVNGTFSSKWHANFWDETLQQNVPTIFNQYNFHYGSVGSCDLTNVFLTGFTMAISQQVGTLPGLPRWGLLSNKEGIPSGAPYAIQTPLAVNAGVATLTLRYTGPQLSLYQGVQPWLWMQTDATSKVGTQSSVTIRATFSDGTFSQMTPTATVASGATTIGAGAITWPPFAAYVLTGIPDYDDSGP
jgi:hypothetical protein